MNGKDVEGPQSCRRSYLYMPNLEDKDSEHWVTKSCAQNPTGISPSDWGGHELQLLDTEV